MGDCIEIRPRPPSDRSRDTCCSIYSQNKRFVIVLIDPRLVVSPEMLAMPSLTSLLLMTEEESASTRNNVEEVHGQLFEVGPRYVNLSYIGEGAYGMVA
ncbi:hypothetical protein ANCDUO_25025 [Ancylostoma duodenale]|uniref:Uncharacterized protein n=1 Tax=Ancylostoma duodenale TaxID=51022 RepID=A0A0C2F905_9BILA|nr:hypothetical protein ANCDUO_25025 [Ancylostoma duodenale]